MKFINKDLGNRLHGMAFVLWFVMCLDHSYMLWARILSALVLMYFITFGTSKFEDAGYKKIL